MRRLATVLVTAALGASLVACGGGDDSGDKASGGSGGSDDTGGGTVGTRTETDYTVTASLAELPYAAPTRTERVEVTTGDLEQATSLAGYERPTSTDPKKIVPWLRALNGDVTVPSTDITGLSSINNDPTGKKLGFTAADVRSFAELRHGADQFAVLTLFDDAAVSDDLPTSGGLRTTSKGKPGSLTKDPAQFSQFPKVNALATSGDQVAFSQNPAQVKRWEADKGRRLASDKSLAAIAGVLDQNKAYGAYLVEGSFAASGRRSPDAIKARFDAVGVGLDMVDKKPVVHVSYHFPANVAAGARQAAAVWKSGTSSRANVPLEDYVQVTGSKTTGDVVTVTLDTSKTGPQAVLQMLASRDTPFQAGGPAGG